MTKEEILELLKAEAEQNGGKPPGMKKFEKVSGVTEGIWLGKYWSKWSDLLIEAGYTAGEMQGAIDEKVLLRHYLTFIDELGHVPTAPELRIKAFNTDGFPAASTFTRNSSKKRLVGKALSFCKENKEYQHLVKILEASPHELYDETVESNDCAREDGYVYLLEFGKDYKIGNSNNVERRFKEIKTQMPTSGKIVHTIKTGDPAGIEAYWHEFFKQRRTKGEWFRLTVSDVAYFKKRRLM